MPTYPDRTVKIEVSVHYGKNPCVLHMLSIRRRQCCLVLFSAQKVDDINLTVLLNEVGKMAIEGVL